MDHALTILIMAALMLASIGLIGRDLIRGADPKTRLIGGGVMTLGVVAAITIYSVYGDFGRPDAPLSGRADEIAAARTLEDNSRSEAEERLDIARAEAAARPDDIEALFALAEAAAQAGDAASEIETLTSILEATGNPAIKAMIAEALSRQAGGIVTSKALDWIDEALSEDPGDWRARYLKGLYFSQTGDDSTALEYWVPLAEDTAGSPIFPAVAAAVNQAAERLGMDVANLMPDSLLPNPEEDAPQVTLEDIKAMVSGLEERLLAEDSITDHDGWLMLIRSRINLGDEDLIDQRLDDLLNRLEGERPDPALDSQLLIAVTELLLPADNLPEVIPPAVDTLLGRARTLTPDDPSVLFFSGLVARSRGNPDGVRQWWGKLSITLGDDNPLRPLIDDELARLESLN